MNILFWLVVGFVLIRIVLYIYATKSKPANVNSQIEFYKPFFDFVVQKYHIKDFTAQIVINKSFNSLICLEYTGDSSVVNKFISNRLYRQFALKMLKIYVKKLAKDKKLNINTVFRLILNKEAEPIGIICCNDQFFDYLSLK